MKQINNYNTAEANEGGSFKKPGAGGFIAKISSVKDVTEKEYLEICFDRADGEFKDYYLDTAERFGYWLRDGKLIRSYKDSAIGFFKGFITSVETSNPGYKFNWDEQTLVGKLFGCVCGEEEYEKQDGSIGTRLYVARNTSVDNIRAGKFEVPAPKKLNKPAAASAPTFTPVFTPVEDDGDLPF